MLSMHMQRRPVVRHELHDSPTTRGRQNSPYLEAQHDAHSKDVAPVDRRGGWGDMLGARTGGSGGHAGTKSGHPPSCSTRASHKHTAGKHGLDTGRQAGRRAGQAAGHAGTHRAPSASTSTALKPARQRPPGQQLARNANTLHAPLCCNIHSAALRYKLPCTHACLRPPPQHVSTSCRPHTRHVGASMAAECNITADPQRGCTAGARTGGVVGDQACRLLLRQQLDAGGVGVAGGGGGQAKAAGHQGQEGGQHHDLQGDGGKAGGK